MNALTAQNWMAWSVDVASGNVVARPDDGRSVLTRKATERALRLVSEIERLGEQVGRLLDELAAWTEGHADRVECAYLAAVNDGFQFLVMQRGKAFDRLLEDDLTDLDIRVAQDASYDLIRFGVMALPACRPSTIASFLPGDGVLGYRNADRAGASGPGEPQPIAPGGLAAQD